MPYRITHLGRPLALFEKRTICDRYTFVAPNGHELPDIPPQTKRVYDVPSIGEGGLATVLRIKDELGITRALKLGLPSIDRDESLDLRTLTRELQYTNSEPFKHVLRILDLQRIRDMNETFLIGYIMDFIEGLTLGLYLRNAFKAPIARSSRRRSVTYESVFVLLDQMVAALRELHESDIVHLDVKPSNFLVSCGTLNPGELSPPTRAEQKLFLTDLGSARKVRGTTMPGRTKIAITPDFFPDRYKPALNWQDPYEIDRDPLRHYGQQIDLFAFGRTIELLFLDRWVRQQDHLRKPSSTYQPWRKEDLYPEREAKKSTFWRDILGTEYQVLEMITDELLAGKVESAASLAGSLHKVSRHRPSDLRSSQILTDIYPGMQWKAPYELITTAEPLQRILEHPTFTRLKRLNQLSLVYQTFPGATHSRFVHSILTFNLAKRLLLALGRTPQFRYKFNQQDIDTILCSALLHDLGQYPFAHALEDLRKTGGTVKGCDYLNEIRHDHELLRTAAMIEDSDGHSIAYWVEQLGVPFDDVVELVSKGNPATGDVRSVGREIINSTIDVDRISYLQLDSYMTGVPFGYGIDVDGILDNLTLKQDGSLLSLAIHEDGVSAAEMVLAAVYWMYRNVYWHPDNRKVMAAMKHVVASSLRERKLDFRQYFQATLDDRLQMDDRKALEYLNQTYLDTEISRWGNPISALSEGRRIPYHQVFEVGRGGNPQGVWSAILSQHEATALEELDEAVASLLGRDFIPNDPAILWDIPRKTRMHFHEYGADGPETAGEKSTGIQLWVRLNSPEVGTGRQWVHLEEFSALVRTLAEEEDRRARKIRLFVAEDVLASSHLAQQPDFTNILARKLAELARQWAGISAVTPAAPSLPTPVVAASPQADDDQDHELTESAP